MRRVGILLLCVVSFSIWALPKQSVDMLTKPTVLLSQGRLTQAAKSYHAQSNLLLTLETSLGTSDMWKSAGLSSALAAMVAEKNNDAMAYQYWSNSVRYFLMGGSSWQDYQSQILTEFTQVNNRLQVSVQQGGGGVTLDDAWLQQLSIIDVWESKLDFFSYKAPTPGLVPNKLPRPVQVKEHTPNQYKKHSPQSKLIISPSYTANPTFIPKPPNQVKPMLEAENEPSAVTSTFVEKSSDVNVDAVESTNDATSPESEKTENIQVEAIPLELRNDFDETEIGLGNASTQELGNQRISENSEEEVTAKQVHRSNLETTSTQGVSAVHLRSFAPEAEK